MKRHFAAVVAVRLIHIWEEEGGGGVKGGRKGWADRAKGRVCCARVLRRRHGRWVGKVHYYLNRGVTYRVCNIVVVGTRKQFVRTFAAGPKRFDLRGIGLMNCSWYGRSVVTLLGTSVGRGTIKAYVIYYIYIQYHDNFGTGINMQDRVQRLLEYLERKGLLYQVYL